MRNVYPIKCRVRNDATTTRVDVYDDIGAGGWFSDGVSAGDFANQLAGVRGPLEVHINSGGGDVFDGIAILNTIKGHKGPTTTVADGLAASIASAIFQAGKKRVVQPGAMVMIHDAFGSCIGNAAEMTKMAGTLDQVSDNIAGIYADRAGGSKEQWRAAMREENWYDAEQTVANGLADEIGTEAAVLPAGLDLAAFTALPGRIAAALRTMPAAPQPQDAARHDPMTGTHSHPHPAYGSQGGDTMHSHEHTHDGDANHSHDHGGSEPDDDAQDHAGGLRNAPGKPYKPVPYQRKPDETVQCPSCKKFNDTDAAWCDQCGSKLGGRNDVEETTGTGGAQGHVTLSVAGDSAGLDDLFVSWLQERVRVRDAAGVPGSHGDHERFDPDGDGDCDACPEGDTDHDYWTPAGEQLQDVPGKPMPAGDQALTAEAIRALIREEIAAAFSGAADGVDNSAWDASKAWHAGAESDDPAAFYAGICAGQKAGDKATQDAWALPYKYKPGGPVNAAGVKNALARLPQTQGLTNEAEAKATLQAAMKKVNPDYEPEDSAGDLPGADEETDLSGIDLEQIRSALRGAFA
jgi:ATP-dependent protease ClpP protease subunit